MLINPIYRLIFVVGVSQRQKLKEEPAQERGLGPRSKPSAGTGKGERQLF